MSNAVRTPRLTDPSLVMQAIAYFGDPADLVPLGIMVDVTIKGLRLMMRNNRQTKPIIAALCKALQLSEKDLESISDGVRTGSDTRNLGQELLSHLLHRDWVNESDAVPRQGEKLIITTNLDDDKTISLLDKINVHATNCRAGFCGSGMADGFSLFHLRDDPVRGSTLLPFLNAYSGLEAPILSAYHTEFGTVFLPKPPPQESLVAIAHIMDRAPELFDFAANNQVEGSVSPLLFALLESKTLGELDTHGRDVCLDLRNCRFFGSQFFANQPRPEMISARPSLNPEQDIENLQRKLRDPSGQFAHKLHLREDYGELIAHDDLADLAYLKSERKALDLRIKHLDAGLPTQAVLLRVTDKGLDKVIGILRGMVAQSQSWEGVSYRAESQPGNLAERRHVFLFEAALARDISVYARLEGTGEFEWFRGDRNWTTIYGAFTRIQIMVPWKSALHPLPHSWNGDQIDTYIAQMVSHWSGDKISLPPQNDHVLIFRPEIQGGESEIAVDVYKAEHFRPISGETLIWLNALQTDLSADTDISGVNDRADERENADLAVSRVPKLEHAKAVLDAQEETMLAYGEKSTLAIFESIEKEIDMIAKQMNQRIGLIRELGTAAADMESKYKTASGRLSGIQQKDKAFAEKATFAATREVREMNAFMDELEKRERVADAAIARTTARIQEMHANISKMKSKLRWWSDG